MVKFLFFAQLAEEAGIDSVEMAFEVGHTVRDYLTPLADKVPESVIATLKYDATMMSINQQFASWDDELTDGDEVGLLPPFSGG